MISTLLTVAVSLASFTSASAVPYYRRDTGILRLPITTTQTNVTHYGLSKRQTVSTTENVQTGTRYMVEFAIGTPPQNLVLQLDTGSSESWVNPTCSSSGTEDGVVLCSSFPVYQPSLSTSAVDLGTTNTLKYGIGIADIEYYTDSFLLGGATVTATKFGVGETTTGLPFGLMGIGPGLELVGYPTIIDNLASQGVTNSRAFSLDLRSIDSPDGAIIFGGIDTKKYSGALEKLPIIPAAASPDHYNRYWVHMSSIGITKPGQDPKLYAPSSSDPAGQPVFLDSGGTLSRLPTDLVNSIITDFPGAIEDGTSGLYVVDCSTAAQDGTVDFGFGNTIIHVPYNDFIWHIQGLCYLGVAADDESPVLGDSFLRAAFVVYDQDNQNLHVAQAANCGTNLVAIGKGVDAVPSIVGECEVPRKAGLSSSSSSVSSSATSTASGVSGMPNPSAIPTSVPYPLGNGTAYAGGPTGTGAYGTGSGATYIAGPTATGAITYTTKTVYSTSTYTSGGVVTTTVIPSTTVCPVTKATSTSTKYTTSTIYATHKYTNAAGVVTEVVKHSTTVCPVSAAPTTYSTGYRTSTIYATTTYTISKCAEGVANCPYGQTTTEKLPVSTTVHPYVNIYVGNVHISPASYVANPAPLGPAAESAYYSTVTTAITVPVYPTVAAVSQAPSAVPPAAYSAIAPPAGSASATGALKPTGTPGPLISNGAGITSASLWSAGLAGLVLVAMI